MPLAHTLSWTVLAKEPTKWGRRTTDEEKEEMLKEKHTPGKKKKRGRSQLTFDPTDERFAGRSKPKIAEDKGKPCGDSYIAKEDICHEGELDFGKDSGSEQSKAPSKPLSPNTKDSVETPPQNSLENVSQERVQQEGAPSRVVTPENGVGRLSREGYLADSTDGIYVVQKGNKEHRIYFPRIVDQAAAQYLCSGIARLMGLIAQSDYYFENKATNQMGAGQAVLPFVELDELQLGKLAQSNPAICGWLIHSVLVRNDTPTGSNFDNMVLLKSGQPIILHFGGTLLWTELGNRRTDGLPSETLPELRGLRASEINWDAAAVFGKITDEQVLSSVAQYLKKVKEKDILDLVDSAKFAPKDRSEIGAGLIGRKRTLEAM